MDQRRTISCTCTLCTRVEVIFLGEFHHFNGNHAEDKMFAFKAIGKKKRISAVTFPIKSKRNRDDKCYDINGLQSSIN